MENLNNYQHEQIVSIQGRLHNLRPGKKNVFVILRDRHQTLQLVVTDEINRNIILNLKLESIIKVTGKLMKLKEGMIKSCTITDMEIHVGEIKVISENKYDIPIAIHNSDKIQTHMDTMLTHRTISLRTLENQSIFQVQSLVCQYFREYMAQNGFMEIHTPKIIQVASESGAQVFKLDYFGKNRYLAQSPQLYKQMMINAGCKRVYEIGPIFRAEKSMGPRHLTEFNGLDMEMEIENNYVEVIHMLYNFLVYLFDNLTNKHQDLLKNIPSYQPIQYNKEPLIVDYYDCIQMLEESGYEVQCRDDINTADEKQIGKVIKEKYGIDLFVINNYPKECRPFYSMPGEPGNNPPTCKSYDFILRGNEILSGAQRVNDYEMLCNNASEKGLDIESIKEYADSFKYGSPPHGGGGFGMERITMFLLNIDNIRLASLFPNYYVNNDKE